MNKLWNLRAGPRSDNQQLVGRVLFDRQHPITSTQTDRIPSRIDIQSRIDPFERALGVSRALKAEYSPVVDVAIEGARALSMHDQTTGDHSLKVALLVAIAIAFLNKVGKNSDLISNLAEGSKYSQETWQKLLETEQAYRAILAGFLHDLGKVNIPQELLDNERKLFPEEIAIMREHDIFSYLLVTGMAEGELLEAWRKYSDLVLEDRSTDIRFVAPALAGAGHHTPGQILQRIGEENVRIPIEKDVTELLAEIVGIFDFYEAVTSFWRRYHVAKSSDEAIDLIGQISKIEAKERNVDYDEKIQEVEDQLRLVDQLERRLGGPSEETSGLRARYEKEKMSLTTKKTFAGFDLGVFQLFRKLYDRDDTLAVLGFTTQQVQKFKESIKARGKEPLSDKDGRDAYNRIKRLCNGNEQVADAVLLTPVTSRKSSKTGLRKDQNLKRIKDCFNAFKPQYLSERGTKMLAIVSLATLVITAGSYLIFNVSLGLFGAIGVFGTLMALSYLVNLPAFKHDNELLSGMTKNLTITTAIFGILELFGGDLTNTLAIKATSFLLINGFIQSLTTLPFIAKLAKHYLYDSSKLTSYYLDGTFENAYMYLTAATRSMDKLRK